MKEYAVDGISTCAAEWWDVPVTAMRRKIGRE
jgi:hypothetical protein